MNIPHKNHDKVIGLPWNLLLVNYKTSEKLIQRELLALCRLFFRLMELPEVIGVHRNLHENVQRNFQKL